MKTIDRRRFLTGAAAAALVPSISRAIGDHPGDLEPGAAGLNPGTPFYYRFEALGEGSSIGRTPSPNAEIVGLGDYRERHAQDKADADLQEAHRQHPFITVWDDHESANDAWQDGAENHQADEGSWSVRKAAAIRACLEWMPIRDPGGAFRRSGRIFRSFRFGDLARIDVLDTRLFGRAEQLPAGVDPLSGSLLVDPSERPAILAALADPERQLLGSLQERWLFASLERAQREGTQWSVIGQQVMMGHTTRPRAAAPSASSSCRLESPLRESRRRSRRRSRCRSWGRVRTRNT